MIPKTVFLTITITLLLAIPTIHIAHADIVPLDWTDSKKELKPGYTITISVHAEGNGILGLADAGFKLEDSDGRQWKFGITQDGRDVYVFMEGAGYVYKLDHLSPWKISKQNYDDDFYVKVYCPGDAPPGETPQDGYLWVSVKDSISGKERHYLARDPGPGNIVLNIYWFAESGGGLKSKVSFGESTKFSNCGGNYGGDLPRGGESRNGDKTSIDWDKYIKWGFALIVVYGFLMILSNIIRR